MRWTRRGRSANLEDRRGRRGRSARGGMGLGTLLVLVVLSVVFRQDFVSLLGPSLDVAPGTSSSSGGAEDFTSSPAEEELVDFVSFVLDDLQESWHRLLPGDYRDARLVLFRDSVRSACGMAGSATGPFYCPGDNQVYLDLSFFEQLRGRFGAPGDFAQAYVIAHEIGHHIQNLLGIERQVREMQARNPSERNELSVRLELQADCLAGVWGASSGQRGILEPGDVEEGLGAAAAIGDDRIQQQSQGYVTPDAFTHGSSADRVEWLRRGLNSGDPNQCDTFGSR